MKSGASLVLKKKCYMELSQNPVSFVLPMVAMRWQVTALLLTENHLACEVEKQ